MTKKRKSYTRHYKLEVLNIATRKDQSLAQVEREFGITRGLLYKWRKRLGNTESHEPPPAAIEGKTPPFLPLAVPEDEVQMADTTIKNNTKLDRNTRQKNRRRAASPTARRITRFLRRVRWRHVLIAVVAVLAVVIVSALIVATDAVNHVQAAWNTLERQMRIITGTMGNDLTLEDFERLQIGLQDLSDSLVTARNQTRFLRGLGALNADLDITFQLLDAAGELSLASTHTLAGLEPALFFLTSGDTEQSVVTQVSSGERVAELLRLGRARFIVASEHLATTETILNDITLESGSSQLLLFERNIAAFYDEIREINTLLLEAPDLLTVALGLDADQHYLVLAQNNDEIRPSGGYISTYGWLVVRNARITDYDYQPTTATSPTPPPDSFAETFTIPDWWFNFENPVTAAWDGSWSPSFPATAELAARFYDAGENPQAPINGVIAIDVTGFEYLLEGLGSVDVAGYDTTVTPENFREVVYEIRGSRDTTLAHKEFLAALYKQIMTDWRNIDREGGVRLVGATLRALQEKHIMLYLRDDDLNAALDALQWSGRQQAVDSDYLMVVDANLTNKSNHSIIRQLTYDVALQPDGTLDSRLTIGYDYPAQIAAEDPAIDPAHYGNIDYYNLLQVFVPPGSTLIETDNLSHIPDQVESDDFTRFIELTRVPYDAGERLQFTYTTPALVEEIGQYRRYRLLIQKQPGTIDGSANIQVLLPAGATMISTTPEHVASYMLGQPVLEFQIDVNTDQWVEVLYTE